MAEVEDALYRATEFNGLVAGDGQHRCWTTIRSGLGAGLLESIDLDPEHRKDYRGNSDRAVSA